MPAHRRHDYDPEKLLAAAAEHASLGSLAKSFGIAPNTLIHFLARYPELDAQIRRALKKPEPRPPKAMDTPGKTIKPDGEVIVVGEPIRGPLSEVTDAEGWLRERWGFPADEWIVGSVTGNSWEGPGPEGTIVTYSQIKGSFRKLTDLGIVSPAVHVPELVRPRAVRRKRARTSTWVCEYDHQAPYNDLSLDAATTAMVQDLQPDGHLFGGDTLDLPTIGKHPDHPAAQATPQECVEAAYALLRRRAEAAPNAKRVKIRGNHDWRIAGEQLARAERMYGLSPAGESEPALSLRRLLHLDTLGIELVEDPRGWQHDEYAIVPGPYGLVARHGWLTGANTAERSVKKRGRSIIVGHTHQPEHVHVWDPSMGIHRQGVVAGAMCLARNVRFPHFTTLDGWEQGPVIVTVHSDRLFTIEQTKWYEGKLYRGADSWKPR